MAFHDFDFGGTEAVKLIDQGVNLAIQRGAFIAIKVLVLVAPRGVAKLRVPCARL
jgi:hypothetical protein